MIVSSEAVSGRTTSTSLIIGAGLKKWMPHTWSGRSVAIAISTTGERRGVGGEDRLGLDDAGRARSNSVALDRQVLDDGLDDEVAVAQAVQIVGGRDPPEDRLALVLGQALAGHLLGESGVEAGSTASAPAWVRERTTTSKPGSGGHFGEAGSHDPRPDDSNGADRSHTRKLATGR